MLKMTKHSLRKLFRPCLIYSTVAKYCQAASQSVVRSETASSHQPLVKEKKTQKFPFAKSLFLGRFDYDVLTYPEVLDKEQLQTLNELVAPIEKFFSQGTAGILVVSIFMFDTVIIYSSI